MSTQILSALVIVFVAVAMIAWAIGTLVSSRAEPARRRMSELIRPKTVVAATTTRQLAETADTVWDKIVGALPSSRGTSERLRREMAFAGWDNPSVPALFSVAEIVLPIVLGGLPFFLVTGTNRFLAIILGAFIGYMAPGFVLKRRVAKRQKDVQNGLADALDLLVLCLEAGSSLDQALVKAGEELGMAYPALGDQIRILITEMRAGKPRLEAFKGLADRTRVDEVRSLVAMLVQTDRFGTSVAQALRTHADVCRTKRRQRAEERAQKVGVKLVFPLVFCLFPALYVIMLGPAYIQFSKIFGK